MDFRIPLHKRLDYCVICDDKIPDGATPRTHQYINREQMVSLFMDHNIILRPKGRICNKIDMQHLYFNDIELAQNIPVQQIPNTSNYHHIN